MRQLWAVQHEDTHSAPRTTAPHNSHVHCEVCRDSLHSTTAATATHTQLLHSTQQGNTHSSPLSSLSKTSCVRWVWGVCLLVFLKDRKCCLRRRGLVWKRLEPYTPAPLRLLKGFSPLEFDRPLNMARGFPARKRGDLNSQDNTDHSVKIVKHAGLTVEIFCLVLDCPKKVYQEYTPVVGSSSLTWPSNTIDEGRLAWVRMKDGNNRQHSSLSL